MIDGLEWCSSGRVIQLYPFDLIQSENKKRIELWVTPTWGTKTFAITTPFFSSKRWPKKVKVLNVLVHFAYINAFFSVQSWWNQILERFFLRHNGNFCKARLHICQNSGPGLLKVLLSIVPGFWPCVGWLQFKLCLRRCLPTLCLRNFVRRYNIYYHPGQIIDYLLSSPTWWYGGEFECMLRCIFWRLGVSQKKRRHFEEERKLETSCQRGRIKETFKLGYSIGTLIFRTKGGEPK